MWLGGCVGVGWCENESIILLLFFFSLAPKVIFQDVCGCMGDWWVGSCENESV